MHRQRFFVSSIAAAILGAALIAPVLGSPSSGILSGPILARGDFATLVDLKLKVTTAHGVDVASASGAGDVAVQRIELGPNGSTGWHTHPGPAIAVVQAGSLTIVSAHDGACESVTYDAGDAFVDQGQGHAHLGRNPSGTSNTVVFVTYFDVGAAGVRIDVPDPQVC